MKQSLQNGVIKLWDVSEGCTRAKIYLNLYLNWLFHKPLSIQNIPNQIPNQHSNHNQEQMQSKEDTNEIPMSTSESLLIVWDRRCAAKTPPLLLLRGGGSGWPRH